MIPNLALFPDLINEVDTSESYQAYMMFSGENILLPLINVSLSNHPINPSPTLRYINRCYIFFTHVYSIKINQVPKILTQDVIDTRNTFYVGALDFTSRKAVELEVESEKEYLVLRRDSILSDEHWLPIDTPKYRKNLSDDIVYDFLNDNLQIIIEECRIMTNNTY